LSMWKRRASTWGRLAGRPPRMKGENVFDSPFEYCTRCGEYVLLDQTNAQCAREHRCRDLPACPLRTLFTGIRFVEGRPALGNRGQKRSAKA